MSVTGVDSLIRPRSCDPSRALSNAGSLTVRLAATTLPGWLNTSSVLKCTRVLVVTASCDMRLSDCGSTQCPAVSTHDGAISVPVHRLVSTVTTTTDGYSPSVVRVP